MEYKEILIDQASRIETHEQVGKNEPGIFIVGRKSGGVGRFGDMTVQHLLQRVDTLAFVVEGVHEMHSAGCCRGRWLAMTITNCFAAEMKHDNTDLGDVRGDVGDDVICFEARRRRRRFFESRKLNWGKTKKKKNQLIPKFTSAKYLKGQLLGFIDRTFSLALFSELFNVFIPHIKR